MSSLAGSEVRLAELVASMSLATDLGLGQPQEHVLRSCILGLRIAEDLELSHVGRGQPPARRAARLGSLVISGRDALAAMESTHCVVAGVFAMRLGLGT